MSLLNLTVRQLTGRLETIQISQSATVLDLKKTISAKLGPDVPYYRIKLIANYKGPRTGTVLDDDTNTLASYSSTVTNNSTLFLLVDKPFKIYVQDPANKIHEIEVPAKDPKVYSISELKEFVQTKCGRSLSNYQFKFNGKPLEESNHGRKLTLQDHEINELDTVFLMQLGFNLDITQPMVDICFMMDCTGSMGSWIEGVKNNITAVRDRLETQYKGCDLQVSFVRYTDFDIAESDKTTWLDFTKSIPDFHSFVNPIKARGGGDTPEDIMSALKVTMSLSWRSSSAKVLIHIADAPCHGIQYHSHNAGGDSYPNGDPAGISHDQMMQEVARLDIQYWFGYIRQEDTDKMIGVFNDSLKYCSSQRLLIRQFNATDPKQLADAIHKSVTASVTVNEARKASALSTSDQSEVNWSVLSVIQATKTPTIGTKSIHELQTFQCSAPSVSCSLKIAQNPFNDNEESIVFQGLDIVKLTLKQLKTADNAFDKYSKAQEIQVIANAYAHEFNRCKPPGQPAVEFIAVDIVSINGTYYITQEFISGTFEKYNTNSGIVCPDPPHSDLMQAFSHFTFKRSELTILICDLEGVVKGGKVLLINPAINNKMFPKKYGPTDQGFLGIKRFFNSHECNSICRFLDLVGIKV